MATGFNKEKSSDFWNGCLKLAKAYNDREMGKLTGTPTFIPDAKLKEQHDVIVNEALDLLSQTSSLTKDQKELAKKSLSDLFSHYKEVNDGKIEEGPAIGIDLGTTFCCVAVFRNEKSEIIPNFDGKERTPSYVAYPDSDQESDDDDSDGNKEPYFGDTAKTTAHDNPRTTIYDIKRMFGRQFRDVRIQNDMKIWPFAITNDKEEIKVKLGSKLSKSPVEITSDLLSYLKGTAEAYLKSKILNAVVAVPAYFNAHQRQLTVKACKSAGLNVLKLVNEPTAAAVAYNLRLTQTGKTESRTNCLIFDLGGGTLDVAVLTIGSNRIHVQAIGGDPYLGGEDIDGNMVNYCLEEFRKEHGVDLLEEMNAARTSNAEKTKISKRLRRLKLECEKYKCYLSQPALKGVTISLDSMHGATPLVVHITREVFNSINNDLFEKCIQIVGKILEESKVEKKDIDDVVLVGGSSRIPRLKEMLADYFDGRTFSCLVDPDEAVAIGSAMLAFFEDNPEVPNVFIQELNVVETQTEKPTPTSTTATPSESTLLENKQKQKRRQRMDTMKSIKIDYTEFEDGQITSRSLNSTYLNTLFATFMHLREAKLEDLKTNPKQELKKRLAKSQPSTETKQIGIGIYINQSSFQLGFVDPNKKALASISITPDIAFTNRSTKVGMDARIKGKTSNNFNISDLITSQSPKLPGSIAFHGNVCTPCVHEIIAIFFSAVFASFEGSNGVQIENVVVTIPFPTTSMVKERILKALKIVGFSKVQVLSTLLTTAITQVFEKEYYKNVGKPQEATFSTTMFVLDYQPTSFTMGLVELRRSTISVKVSYGSDSISECQDESFTRSHKNLYDSNDEPPLAISDIYKAAIEHVTKRQSSLLVKIAVSDTSSKFIDQALPKMFGDIWKFTSLTTCKGPLMGAALLASASTEAAPNSLTSLLPPNIKIQDATRSFLNLTKELRGKKRNYPSSVLMKNVVDERILIHEEIRLRLNRFNEGPTVVDFLLEEHLVSLEGETTQIFPAGHYKLSLPCRPTEDKEGERFYDKVEITCTMEANGILSLRCKNAEGISLDMEMARSDNSTCVENCGK